MAAFTTGFSPLMAPKAVLLGAGLSKMSPAASADGKKKILATSATKGWDARYSHAVPHTTEYYLKCCMGGVLSCGLTHLAVTPLDVAKCNMQVRLDGLTGSNSALSALCVYVCRRRSPIGACTGPRRCALLLRQTTPILTK